MPSNRNWYPIKDNSRFFNKLEGRAATPSIPTPPSSRSLEDGLARALKQRQDSITHCEHCHSKYIEYQGLGLYLCNECNKITKTKYAKVREYLEEKGNCTMLEIIEVTGLSKSDIEALIQCGSIEYKHGVIGIVQ